MRELWKKHSLNVYCIQTMKKLLVVWLKLSNVVSNAEEESLVLEMLLSNCNKVYSVC